ncbi:MAG: cytochrome c oxidase subunit II [Lentisphaerales bacterium]|nr:cytochrome c oxidase subunit II [Lentisphaerales bacterium]
MLNNTLAMLPELLPPDASTFAKDTDSTFMFITWVCIFFFVAIVGLMTYYVIKYRRKSEDEQPPHISHNLFLEVVWSVVPIILVLFMFYWGYTAYAKMMDPVAVLGEEGAEHIDLYVNGKQWSWDITYPGGLEINSKNSLAMKNDDEFTWSTKKLISDGKENNITSYMTVPVDVPVRLSMTSNDVIHSFAIPAFRIKKDVILNRNSVIWFKATKPGTYIYTCNEMCGIDHGHMIGYLRVVSQEEYGKFLKKLDDEQNEILPKEKQWAAGKKLYLNVCSACHSVDGSPRVGPTWKGLYGKANYEMVDGTKITVDDDYIRESILNPNAKKAKGFGAVPMPAQKLDEKQLAYLMEFIKSPEQDPNKKSEK